MVVATGGLSEEGLKSRLSVRTAVAMASRSALVSPLFKANPVNDWQACRNAWTSSRMTVGSMGVSFHAFRPSGTGKVPGYILNDFSSSALRSLECRSVRLPEGWS